MKIKAQNTEKTKHTNLSAYYLSLGLQPSQSAEQSSLLHQPAATPSHHC